MAKKKESTNGVGPQVRRRTRWIELPDEYEGFEVEIWVNAPTRLWMDLQFSTEVDPDMDEDEQVAIAEQDEATRQNAASKLFLAHNGWRDFDGNEYPPPSEAAFWEDIPTELAACIFTLAKTATTDLPNSLAPNRRRSKRGSRRATRRG